MNDWQIIDNIGVIYSGTEDQMRRTFKEIQDGELRQEWTGDLKLMELHEVIR